MRADCVKDRETFILYECWRGMRYRCGNPSSRRYKYYGGRGISVCERWNSFENFKADMGTRPSPKHSIDRKDGNGNYEPSNCRWATQSQQNTGLRRVSQTRCGPVTIDGVTLSVSEWAIRCGVNAPTICYRIKAGIVGMDLLAPSRRRIRDWASVEWGKPDLVIASEMNCTVQNTRRMRAKHSLVCA